MCRIMEELNAKAAAFTKRKTALNMLRKNKLTLEDIAEYSDLTIDEVKKLADEAGKTTEQRQIR